MTFIARFGQIIRRVITDEYIDLYVLAATASVFTVLGFLGISDIKVLSSIILALLAVLAFSQVRSRRHVAEIAKMQRSDPLSFFGTSFPEDLARRRAGASSLLLIGVSMARTIQASSRVDLRQLLRSGGSMRVLLLDPANDELLRAASRQRSKGLTLDRMRSRILTSLDELEDLRANSNGRLEIRVASFVPPIGVNLMGAALLK